MKRALLFVLCVACRSQQTQAVEIAPLPSASTTASAPVAPQRTASTVIDGVRPVSLAVDATNVYWADEDHAIKKAAVTGGAAMTLATGDSPSSIAVGRSEVYWIDDPGKSLVRAVPIAGGQKRDVANGGHLKLWSVVTDDSHLYWQDYFVVNVATFDALDRPKQISCAEGMMHIAVGPSHVVCDGLLSKTIAVAPLAGGNARVLGTMEAQHVLAIDATDAYWTNSVKPTEIARASLSGGAARTIPAGATIQRPIAIADGRLFVARDDGAIVSLSKEGGAASVLAQPRKETKVVVSIVSKPGWLYVAYADAITRIPR